MSSIARFKHSPSQSISTDEIRAFVELTQVGSFREASQSLHLSPEGLRSRLLMLEQRLGTELYMKQRGRRTDINLTQSGRAFLEKAQRFLEEAALLTNMSEQERPQRELQICAPQCLAYYILVDLVQAFRSEFPEITVRISTMTERQIVEELEAERVSFGICSQIEFSSYLTYVPWFSEHWFFVAKNGHSLLRLSEVSLLDVSTEPLVIFERGSAGRQHVLDAFYSQGLKPKIVAETTTTQTMLRMIEAGMAVGLVPLLLSGELTRDIDVGWTSLSNPIRTIDQGFLFRRDKKLGAVSSAFMNFLLASYPVMNDRKNVVQIPDRRPVSPGFPHLRATK